MSSRGTPVWKALGIDQPPAAPTVDITESILPKAGMVVAAIHGVRRNHGSLLWGLVWGVAGRWAPLIVPAIAVGQGYAEPKKIC